MLLSLTIQDIVLIDRLMLDCSTGLSVLTGETGAGKSILLDSLGLALGARADAGLVRKGAGQGIVTAEFDLLSSHPAFSILAEQDLELEDGSLILRRTITPEGRSRAFVNDMPVSAGVLRRLGDSLVEIHGQNDDRGLLNPSGHRQLLDAFAGNGTARDKVARTYRQMTEAATALAAALATLDAARAEEDWLRHAAEEIGKLAPVDGEEDDLASRRSLMMQGERAADDLKAVMKDLQVKGGIDATLRGALRRLGRMGKDLTERLMPVIDALERAAIEAEEGISGLDRMLLDMDGDPAELEAIEERLFALRALARKHGIAVANLPALATEFDDRIRLIDGGSEEVVALTDKAKTARTTFEKAVAALTTSRVKAAATLDKAISRELPPIKLESARIRTALTALEPAAWDAQGGERVAFEISTNPGAAFGPMKKIASGGELARFILAIKVVLASKGSAPTLIFDEVDRGIGGATADAVGERLLRLADTAQVLVVTHSPQVAARGDNHWHITKGDENGVTLTRINVLDSRARQEEIARMLSGATITDEARAAADQLLGPGA